MNKVADLMEQTQSNINARQTASQRGPIFIGGLAHSGKTALRLALDLLDDVAWSRRGVMWSQFYGRYGDLAVAANFERCLAAMLQRRAIRELCDDGDAIRDRFWQGTPSYGHLFALFHECHAHKIGKSRWGEQSGFVERYADAIYEAYPTARMIHMMRDPRDSCAVAMQKERFRAGKIGWSTAIWLASAGLARRNQKVYGQRYKVVRFESLVAQPEQTLRELCAFLDEPYDAAMAQRAVTSARSKAPGKPATGNSKGSMHEGNTPSLSRRQLAFIQAYTQDALHDLGYPLRSTPLSWRERARLYSVDWPINRAAMVAWQTIGRMPRHALAKA